MSLKLSWRWIFVLATTIAYAPFLNLRLLPTAGDEKVYVTQALEMAESGRLCVQTLFGEPNYFKGPFHYLLIQLGLAVFGLKLIALRYMNLLFVIAAGLAVGTLIERYVQPAVHRGRNAPALWGALGTAWCAGAMGHVLASQMEIELLAAYSVAMLLLDHAQRSRRAELGFWIIAGLTGWMKSPVHSALLGMSYWLYFLLREIAQRDGSLQRKVINLRSMAFMALGCAICISGYLPAAIQDWDAFRANYIDRENLSKSGGNGGPGWQAWFPLFFYYLFPWNWLALALYLSSATNFLRAGRFAERLRSPAALPYLFIAAMLLPIVSFFWWHPYRGENYTYPVHGAVFVLLALLWSRARQGWILKTSAVLTAVQVLIPAAFLLWLTEGSVPDWLPHWSPSLIAVLALVTGIGLVATLFSNKRRFLSGLVTVPFVISIQLLLFWAGDREMTGLRAYLNENVSHRSLCYLNLEKNIWNELGYLSFTLGERVKSCHTPALAAEHLRTGGTLIVMRPEQLEELASTPQVSGMSLGSQTWKRWGRHAHIPRNGRSPLQEVRTTGNWSSLERDFLLVIQKTPGHG